MSDRDICKVITDKSMVELLYKDIDELLGILTAICRTTDKDK